MRKAGAVFKKQWKETLKNKEVLIQFILFPAMAVIMTSTVNIDGMPANFFVVMFAAMYIGMAPLTSIASIIAEEKEKNTLRILQLSDVAAAEYLIGISGYILIMCLGGSVIFAVVGKYTGIYFWKFLAVMAAGILVSMLIGAVIAVFSKSQMNAAAVVVPVMMVFSFLPMISFFNDSISKFSKYVYSQQISNILNNIEANQLKAESLGILAVNFLLAAILFGLAYKRSGLEC